MKNFLMICLAAGLLLAAKGKDWIFVKGDYSTDKFVPRSLFLKGKDSLYCGAQQGLFLYTPKTEYLVPVHELNGKGKNPIRAIATDGKYTYAAFDKENGLYRSVNGFTNWERIGQTQLGDERIWSILCTDSCMLVTVWPRYVFRSDDKGQTWYSYSEGMPAPGSLGVTYGHTYGQFFHDGYLYYSIYDEGVYRRKRTGDSLWKNFSEGLPSNKKVRSILKHKGMMYIATENGVYSRKDSSGIWKKRWATVPDAPVVSLVAQDETMFAGTADGQLFVSYDLGAKWKKVETVFTQNHVLYDMKIMNGYLYVLVDGQRQTVSGMYKKKL